MPASETRWVIVTPGRVAYTTAQAKEKFSDRPKQVIWTPYLQELLVGHGDIQIVSSPAQLMREQLATKAEEKNKTSGQKPSTRAEVREAPAARAPANQA
jgi:hypothetical protein